MADAEYEEISTALSRPETRTGFTRRRFLQASVVGAGAVAAGPYINMASAFAAAPLSPSDGILVVITLGGGNDSLNMVVPTGSTAYYDKRKTIAIKEADALPLAAGLSLHPKLVGLKQRFDAGQVAVVQGVGVPSPDLSHFTSMATWMNGSANPAVISSGWLGRYLDGLDAADLRGAAIGSQCPLHLVGTRTQATAVPTSTSGTFGANRANASDARMFDAIKLFAEGSTGLGPWGDAVAAGGRNTVDVGASISSIFTPAPTGASLTKQLVLAARLINADVGLRVLNVNLGSFDTHVNEASTHNSLYDDLDKAITAFYETLQPGWADAVALMTWSEFGRRLQENSNGTDHGTAASAFVIGTKVKGGLYGEMPSLTSLDRNGNLTTKVDYRSMYASVLEGWMSADSRQILGGTYENLSLFAGAPSSAPPATAGTPAPPPITIPTTVGPGYWMASADGQVFRFGRDGDFGATGLKSPVVTMVTTPSKRGALLVCQDGTVKPAGDARSFGSMAGKKLNGPIRDMAMTASGNGYWMLGSDGGIFAFGDAAFFGSTGGMTLNKPIVGMAATPSGNGYWLVASDGGIFAYGDAKFFGSTGHLKLAKPIVSISATDRGKGYWFVASDGGVFAFGDATFHGSLGGNPPLAPVVAIAS